MICVKTSKEILVAKKYSDLFSEDADIAKRESLGSTVNYIIQTQMILKKHLNCFV